MQPSFSCEPNCSAASAKARSSAAVHSASVVCPEPSIRINRAMDRGYASLIRVGEGMANLLNRVSGLVGKTGQAGRAGGGMTGKAASFVTGFLSGGDEGKGRRGRGRRGGRRAARGGRARGKRRR